MLMMILFFFFFSSRRRHTRLQGDWSSDVCSSDLTISREIVRRFNAFYGLEIEMDGLYQDERAIGFLRRALPKLGGEPVELFRESWRGNIRAAALEWGLENFFNKFETCKNYFYYSEKLREPEVLLTKTPRIPGLDGRKMSKSYGNAITLSETDEEIRKKTKVMVTDPARKRRTDPGNPDVCPVYDWHKLFSAEEPGRLEWVRQGVTTAGIGCIECKDAMATNLVMWIAPVRERRGGYDRKTKGGLLGFGVGWRRARWGVDGR